MPLLVQATNVIASWPAGVPLTKEALVNQPTGVTFTDRSEI